MWRPLFILVPVLLVGVAACGEEEKPRALSAKPLDQAMRATVEAGVPLVSVLIDSADPAPCGADSTEQICGVRTDLAVGKDAGAVDAESSFRIASVSKAFQGAAVLALVDRGTLSLDDTVDELVGPIVEGADQISVGDLLRHTSGLPDYTKQEGFLADFTADVPIEPEDTLDYVAGLPPAFEPGSEFEYSDTDNIVLALIIEEVTDLGYDEALKDLVLDPADLRRTKLATGREEPLPEVSGFQLDGEDPDGGATDVTTALDPLAAGASGALVSTPGDVAGFFAGLRSGLFFSTDLLDSTDDTVAGDSSPPGPPGRGTNESGLAIFRYELPCGEFWGHTGTFPGYTALGGTNGDGGGAFSVLINASDLPPAAERALLEVQEIAACASIGETP
jgi:D-alanyl-D-alanine carboxypeptidase